MFPLWSRNGSALSPEADCERCGTSGHTLERLPCNAYTYLLGLYLGDGCLFTNRRVTSLRITLDTAYPWIIISCADAVEDVRGRRPHVASRSQTNCAIVTSYWRPWRCLLPQHGRGRKHLRPIELEPWQRTLVDRDPRPFIRGLIHSDGWRGTNRVHAKGRDYAYPRYQFSNRSSDIRRLFTDACDLLAIEWRPWGPYHVSIARRSSVAKLDTFIGPKC